jgi:hypothetical protein
MAREHIHECEIRLWHEDEITPRKRATLGLDFCRRRSPAGRRDSEMQGVPRSDQTPSSRSGRSAQSAGGTSVFSSAKILSSGNPFAKARECDRNLQESGDEFCLDPVRSHASRVSSCRFCAKNCQPDDIRIGGLGYHTKNPPAQSASLCQSALTVGPKNADGVISSD